MDGLSYISRGGGQRGGVAQRLKLAATVLLIAHPVFAMRPQQVFTMDQRVSAQQEPHQVEAMSWQVAFNKTAHGLETSVDAAAELGETMSAWAQWNLIAAIVLCGAWAIYPMLLAHLRIPQGGYGNVNLGELSVSGAYDWIDPKFGEGQEQDEQWQSVASGPETYDEHNVRMFQNIPEELRLKRRRIMVAEAWFSTAQPFLAMMVWGTFAGVVGQDIVDAGMMWQMMMIVPMIVRCCRAEAALCQRTVLQLIQDDFAIEKFPPNPFLRSKGEVVDQTTDGMAVVSVFMLEKFSPAFQLRMSAAWGSDIWGWMLAPLGSVFGIAGLQIAILIVAAVMQMVGVLARGDDQGWLAADTAGMGGLSEKLLMTRASETAADLEYKHFGRSLYEGVPQLLLSGTAIIAEGNGMLGSPVLLVSLAFGVLMLTWRSSVLMRLGFDGRGMNTILGGIIIFVVVFWVVCRLVMSETCASKMFNLLEWVCVEQL